jgi:hypothetical protein
MHSESKYHETGNVTLYSKNVFKLYNLCIFKVQWEIFCMSQYSVSACIYVLVQWPVDDLYWTLKRAAR